MIRLAINYGTIVNQIQIVYINLKQPLQMPHELTEQTGISIQ